MRRVAAIGLAVAATAWGCGSTPEPPDADLTRPVVKVAFPDLSALDDDVRTQIERARDAARDAPREERAAAYGHLGMLAHAAGLSPAARAAYRNASSLDPGRFEWRYLEGRVALDDGDVEAAETALRRALELAPGYAPAHVALGDLLAGRGDADGAADAHRRALDLDADCAPALAGLARAREAAGDLDEAARLYDRALAVQPEADALYYPLAQIERRRGNLERAEELLAKRGRRPPGVADPVLAGAKASLAGVRVLIDRGRALASSGAWAEAEPALREAIALDPGSSDARVLLATALDGQGRYRDAVDEYRAALDLDADRPRARYGLGLALASLGRDGEASAEFALAIAADPALHQSRTALARTLERLGRPEEAVVHYDALLARDPADVAAAFRGAIARVAAGRDAEAAALLDRARRDHPDQPALAHAYGRLLAGSADRAVRDPDRALTVLESLTVLSQTVDWAESVAMALAAAGRFDEAVALQTRALEVVHRAGASEQIDRATRRLDLYRAGRPAPSPWTADDPIFTPPVRD